jgi:PPP family 3-phenylpropionic acid transporter
VLFAATLVGALGAGLLAFASDPMSIAFAISTMAIGTGGMIPLADTRAVEIAGVRRERFARARAWGSAAFIVGSIVAGWVMSGRSPDLLFVLYVPLLVATGIAAWRLLARDPGTEAGARSGRRVVRGGPPLSGITALLRLRGLSLLLVGVTAIWTAIGAVMAFISIHVANLGADLATIGLMWGLGAAVEIPIMLAFPTLAKRVGSERLLLLGAVAFALRAAGWGLVTSPFAALLIAPLGGVGFALFYVGIVSFVAKSVPPGAQATAQGLYTGMTFSLGSVVGSVVAGLAAPVIGLSGLFLASAVATVLATLVVARAVTVVRPMPAAAPSPASA